MQFIFLMLNYYYYYYYYFTLKELFFDAWLLILNFIIIFNVYSLFLRQNVCDKDKKSFNSRATKVVDNKNSEIFYIITSYPQGETSFI